MRDFRPWGLWICCWATLASATDLGPSSPKEDAPTSYACSVQTLRNGKSCVFEAELQRSTDTAQQAKSNLQSAKEMITSLCTWNVHKAGKKTEGDTFAVCEKEFEPSLELCALREGWPLLDGQGRFAVSAKPCYTALSGALAKTRVIAAVAAPCCRCLSAKKCAGVDDQCFQSLARRSPENDVLACMRSSCANVCEDLMPREDPQDELRFYQPIAPSPTPKKKPASGTTETSI